MLFLLSIYDRNHTKRIGGCLLRPRAAEAAAAAKMRALPRKATFAMLQGLRSDSRWEWNDLGVGQLHLQLCRTLSRYPSRKACPLLRLDDDDQHDNSNSDGYLLATLTLALTTYCTYASCISFASRILQLWRLSTFWSLAFDDDGAALETT